MMIKTMTTRLLWIMLPLMGVVTVGCADSGADDWTPANQQAIAAPTAPSPAPVVQGLGGASGEPAMPDTIDLRLLGYTVGAEDAPITVYEFSDFGCPYCGMFALDSFPLLYSEFIETGLVRWTYVPFVMGMFPNGAEAARAAECAAEQDAFWEMHDALYQNQNEWKSSRDPEVQVNGYAADLGLDEAQFATCYEEDRGGMRTALNNRAANALRVRATPSFFINGRLLEGALPVQQFQQIFRALANQ